MSTTVASPEQLSVPEVVNVPPEKPSVPEVVTVPPVPVLVNYCVPVISCSDSLLTVSPPAKSPRTSAHSHRAHMSDVMYDTG